MKKMLTVFLMGAGVLPSVAQKVPVKNFSSVEGLNRAVTTAARNAAVANAAARKLVPLLNFTEPAKVYFQSAVPTKKTKKIKAQLLHPEHLREVIFPPKQAFVPQGLTTDGTNFYRGMQLSTLDDLKNLLVNGLERSRSYYDGDIFVSPEPYIALNHALPRLWDTWNGKMQVDLPVLVQIPVTEQLLLENAPKSLGPRWIFNRRDVAAYLISDVWVFLEVNEVPGWYKATLENDEVVLSPVPGEWLDLN